MNRTTAAQDIVALEQRFFQTMVEKDVKTASNMMADTAIITGAQGASAISRATFEKMMNDGKWELLDFELQDPQVEFPSDDVAVIGYKVRQTVRLGGQRFDMRVADASTWVHDGTQWRCVQHAEALLGDPYGRDRQAPAH